MSKTKRKQRRPRRPPAEPQPATPPPSRPGLPVRLTRWLAGVLKRCFVVPGLAGLPGRFLLAMACWWTIAALLVAARLWQQTHVIDGHWLRMADYYGTRSDAVVVQTGRLVTGLLATLVIAFGAVPGWLGVWVPRRLVRRGDAGWSAPRAGWLTALYWLWSLGFACVAGACFWPLGTVAEGWVTGPPLLVVSRPVPGTMTAQHAWLIGLAVTAIACQLLVGYLLAVLGTVGAGGLAADRRSTLFRRSLVVVGCAIPIGAAVALFTA